jgi:hypothetical protein
MSAVCRLAFQWLYGMPFRRIVLIDKRVKEPDTGRDRSNDRRKGGQVMSPRFRRTLLLLSVLSLLVVPTGRAEAQTVEEFAAMMAAQVIGCDPQSETATSHIRCEGVLANASFTLEATRVNAPGEGVIEELRCEPGDVGDIAFRARHTLGEGRGFIAPGGSFHIVTAGQLVRVLGGVPLDSENVNCRVRKADGVFHRVGTVVYGRITVDAHAETVDSPTGVIVWREIYCTSFSGSAVPDPFDPSLSLTLIANGRVPCTADTAAHDVGRGLPDIPPFFGDDAMHG